MSAQSVKSPLWRGNLKESSSDHLFMDFSFKTRKKKIAYAEETKYNFSRPVRSNSRTNTGSSGPRPVVEWVPGVPLTHNVPGTGS